MFNSGILVQQARHPSPGRTNGRFDPCMKIRHIRQTRFNRNLFPGLLRRSGGSVAPVTRPQGGRFTGVLATVFPVSVAHAGSGAINRHCPLCAPITRRKIR